MRVEGRLPLRGAGRLDLLLLALEDGGDKGIALAVDGLKVLVGGDVYVLVEADLEALDVAGDGEEAEEFDALILRVAVPGRVLVKRMLVGGKEKARGG